jgi:cobalt-zinc-cadmium efflux system membrane fusion protein
MKLKLPITILAVLAFGAVAALYVHAASTSQTASANSHGEATKPAETAKGPHNGRILTDGDFTLELAIFENDVPPEFRAWMTQAGKPVSLQSAKLTVKLIRPGNKIDVFNFMPQGDFLRGDQEVNEPHSFSFDILAEYEGRTHRWQFDAPEMQTTILAASAENAGMKVETVGPATLGSSLSVYGQVMINGDRIARAGPRFGGIVREARKSLGDPVKAGEVVARVESNQSLVTTDVKAPIAGVVVERDTMAGETVSDGAALYTIADLSDVWIDLNIPKREQARVKIGQTVIIRPDDGGESATGQISWISPVGQASAQTVVARVVLKNLDGRWRPGLSVKAEIALSEKVVNAAVRESAIQSLYSFTVVFSQHGELYQARPLELGEKGGGWVEVIKGITPGEQYVVANSFLIKADIGKSGASHDH